MTDDKGVIRIGRPPAGPPVPAQPRRRTAVLIAVIACVFLGVGAAGMFFFSGLVVGRDSAAAPSQVPMPTQSTPNLKVLDMRATCVLLVPAARDGAEEVLALTQKPDGSTVDWARMQKAHDDLRLIAEVAAPELRDDVNQQAAMLSALLSIGKTGGKMTIEFDDFKKSGVRIGARCDQYAD